MLYSIDTNALIHVTPATPVYSSYGGGQRTDELFTETRQLNLPLPQDGTFYDIFVK